jgi:outer membrane protein with beta-barrel domain
MALRVSVFVLAALVLTAVPAVAQSSGFGVGPRLTFVRGGDPAQDSQRFTGAAMRLGAGKAALEVAIDFRSQLTGDLTERVKDYPIQASLLLFPVRTRIAPYVLGGLGWYSQRVEPLLPVQTEAQTTRKVGYHAGFGGELLVHRHVGIYGDYRYTFIRFGGEDASAPINLPLVNRLKMAHEGSMFTWGATFYF